MQWVLPTIPQIISTVRTMQKEHYVPAQPSSTEDLLARIEKLEQGVKLQARINEELTTQLQQLRKRLQILTFVTLSGLILVVVGLGILISR